MMGIIELFDQKNQQPPVKIMLYFLALFFNLSACFANGIRGKNQL